MSDRQWTHPEFPSLVGAFGAALSSLIGVLGVVFGVWILRAFGHGPEVIVGYVLYVYLVQSALATYRKWQSKGAVRA